MPTQRELQTAHVQEIVYRLYDITSVLDLDKDLWYGGFPPALEQIRNFVESQTRRIGDTFSDVVIEPRPTE